MDSGLQTIMAECPRTFGVRWQLDPDSDRSPRCPM